MVSHFGYGYELKTSIKNSRTSSGSNSMCNGNGHKSQSKNSNTIDTAWQLSWEGEEGGRKGKIKEKSS